MIRRRLLMLALASGLFATAGAEALPPDPPATTVSASYMMGREWQVSLDITPPAKEIFVALGTGEFASTGFWTALTGEAVPKTRVPQGQVARPLEPLEQDLRHPRGARYSIDSDALDKVIPLPPCNLKEPHAHPPSTYVSYASLPRKPGVAKVQILYLDGTRSEVVTLPGEERD